MQVYPVLLKAYVLIAGFGLIACAPTKPQPPSKALVQNRAGAALHAHEGLSLSDKAKKRIGYKIWQNESGGTVAGLTHWNTGEEFPSMGIGHFIWYPMGFKGRWTESFPLFVAHAIRSGHQDIPRWVLENRHCPWPDKAAFQRDFNGARLSSLRAWLANNVTIQTDYIIATSRQALPKVLSSSPAAQRSRIKANYDKVAASASGTYALIDYVNFKGDGTNPTEQYKGHGWGLMWVLMEMRDVPAGQAAAIEFSSAAKRCLDRRIRNSPPARGEARWQAGWHNRCDTYTSAL